MTAQYLFTGLSRLGSNAPCERAHIYLTALARVALWTEFYARVLFALASTVAFTVVMCTHDRCARSPLMNVCYTQNSQFLSDCSSPSQHTHCTARTLLYTLVCFECLYGELGDERPRGGTRPSPLGLAPLASLPQYGRSHPYMAVSPIYGRTKWCVTLFHEGSLSPPSALHEASISATISPARPPHRLLWEGLVSRRGAALWPRGLAASLGCARPHPRLRRSRQLARCN